MFPEEIAKHNETNAMEFFRITRTTNVVRNAGCACSRYTQKYFFNQLMNQ